MTSQSHLTPGHLLHDRYSIQRTLGQGGFGITYLAYDKKLDQEVCIKELFIAGNSTRNSNMSIQSQSVGTFSFPDFVKRFLDEARKLARFQHPNIVRVLDLFEAHGTAYMVMEFLPGETLKETVEQVGVMDLDTALGWMHQLLDAVEVVHAKGLLHRDIKPENILLTENKRLVLIDFGAARDYNDGKTATQTAMLTPGFAPPEQYSVRAVRGPQTDIYALGATLYNLVTGTKPLPSTDRINEDQPPAHKLNKSLPEGISDVINRAMELKPENRYPDVAAFRNALNQITAAASPTSKPAGKRTSAKANESKPKRKNRLGLVLGLFFGTMILGFVLMLIEMASYAGMSDSYFEENYICDDYGVIPAEWVGDGDCDCDDCSDE